MISVFKINKIDSSYTGSMKDWLDAPMPEFDAREAGNFQHLLSRTNNWQVGAKKTSK